jgi:flagellar basal-body rod modification protein FlgD
MAQWLGTEVASTGRVLFDGTPVELRFNAAETATRAQLVVEDETGRERARLDMPVSETSFLWDGNDASGAILPGGAYRFAIESFADGQLIARAFAKSFSRVVEVQRADGALLLTLENGATTSADEVGTLRKSAS